MRYSHRQTIGYISFFIAIGVLIGLLISSKVIAVFLIAILLVLGYFCICC